MAKEHEAAAESFAVLVGPGIEDEAIDLLRAGLTIARLEYPELDIEHYAAQVEQLADRVRRELPHVSDSPEFIAALNHVLFQQEGFRGNREDYYDARNSFLNQVIERRLGIPITLSVLYMEVARRLGFLLFGVAMPGHFLVKHYEVDGSQVLIDPFDAGRTVTPRQCQQRLDEMYGGQILLPADPLAAASRRQILTRMLNNLKSIYMANRNFRKALPVVDLILAIYPRSPEDVKQRALLRYSLGRMRDSLADLEDYAKMSPEASDADEIRQMAQGIRRTLALMN